MENKDMKINNYKCKVQKSKEQEK